MKTVGEIFSRDNFGSKAYYKVLSVNEDGTCVAELQVGYVPSTTVEDIIEAVKEAPKKPKPTKKPTTNSNTNTNTKKKS